ncbi:hypothetical protein [Leifsonia aquatica]|uniref:hypothetical protein n=1 Tax=Leifsonia aquatica TaxID=144185 RepID=UPI0037F9D954
MKATDIMDALRAHYRKAALVPELTITDESAVQNYFDLPAEERDKTSRRIDALMFTQLQRTAIEVKVSIADAKRESWAKVRPWTRVTHRFVYAVPAGLIDHPPVYGMGLLWVHDDGRVEVHRKARINPYPEPLPQHVVQTLAYRATGRRSSFDNSQPELTMPASRDLAASDSDTTGEKR